jgi:endoglucanase
VRKLKAGLAAAALVAGISALPLPVSAAATSTASGFSVVQNRLEFDGTPFMAQGLSLVGAEDPSWCLKTLPSKIYNKVEPAAQALTANEMSVYKTKWDVNVVRFQVSQPGLSEKPSQITAYISRIKEAVKLAESAGFGVILSMQDEPFACGSDDPLPSQPTPDATVPSDNTLTAWDNLAPVFAKDPDVMYELFNEPQNTTSMNAWAQWKSGGCPPTPPTAPIACPPTSSQKTWIGEQSLVDDIRHLGAPNVILVDGAKTAATFGGIRSFGDLLTDKPSGNGIVYAVHPFGVHTTAAGQTAYGFLTSQVPVLITAWNYQGCAGDRSPSAEMAWWKTNNIGLIGFSGDLKNTMITSLTTYDPTGCPTTPTVEKTKWVGGTKLQTDFGA